MIDKLKAPFWFGLPLYAWVAGAVALVAGAGYFMFYAKASGAAAVPQLDSASDSTDLTPYPDPGSGAGPVPPSSVFDQSGPLPPVPVGNTTLTAQPSSNPTSTLVAAGTTHATSGATNSSHGHASTGSGGHGVNPSGARTGKTGERGGSKGGGSSHIAFNPPGRGGHTAL